MFPFSSLEEAAANLGRSLTHTESLWLRYSATKPDYIIHAHIYFLFFCALYLCSLPLVLMEAMSPKLVHKFKVQPNVKTPFSRMLRCYKDVFVIHLMAITPLECMFIPFFQLLGIRTSLPLPSRWEVAAQLLVYVLVEDYANYWIHRWMHIPWFYDRFHSVHHEFTAPIGITANYGHWLEILILGLPTVAGPAVVPCHVLTFGMWLLLRQILAIESHCGYDFPWSPSRFIPFYGGAEYHDYHHYVGKSQSNFASLFTYCDYIYGTNKGYRFRKARLANPFGAMIIYDDGLCLKGPLKEHRRTKNGWHDR
ncbi:Methylsterol monooxygenase 1-2 [Nymphaea thermarum]|nr:Methylsterol monooxygenase 1-2 [Nymphaea thermarum]